MALATWWNTDSLPTLSTLPGFRAGVAFDTAMLAGLNRLPIAEVLARRREGHRPYVAFLHGMPVAYGWVATRVASIGELKMTITLPPTDRYLWDFATLPAWQGRGIYPRLLQAILQQESRAAERFWIIYAPENTPSGAGMRKAGFSPVAELSFDADRRPRAGADGSHAAGRAADRRSAGPLLVLSERRRFGMLAAAGRRGDGVYLRGRAQAGPYSLPRERKRIRPIRRGTMMETMIELRSLGKTYRPRTGPAVIVLHDVELTVAAGQAIGVLGPPGAGKTTMIRLLGGRGTGWSRIMTLWLEPRACITLAITLLG